MIPVIGAKRLSDVTDESTSLERQDVSINSWAAFKTASTGEEYRVIEITEDADVSGIISPFDREGLGPWLAYPKLDRWKILVVARLDRLTRSIRDFETLWRWLEAHDKILVSIAENIDFGTPTGRLIGRQLVLFAEYEREMTKTRVKDAVTDLRQSGKYPGGQFPFGYVPTKLEPKGWGFEPHPIYGDRILPEVVNRLLAGESLRSLCRWLDRESIPTPRNAVREYNGKPLLDAHWQPQSLTKILTSPAIVGQTATTGGALYDSEGNLNKRTAPQAVRDASGLVITRAEPLIDNDTWEQVKTLLVRNAGRAGPRLNTSPLLRVAFCLFCKSPLYVAKNRTGGKEYRYYLCPKANRDKTACASRRVPADTLEGYVESKLLAKIGDLDYEEPYTVPGDDTSTRMAELAEAIGYLSGQIALAKATGGNTSQMEAQKQIHERNLDELAEQPRVMPRQGTHKTGETWAQHYRNIEPSDRNQFLRNWGVRVETARRADGKIMVQLWSGWRSYAGEGQRHGMYQAVTSPQPTSAAEGYEFATREPDSELRVWPNYAQAKAAADSAPGADVVMRAVHVTGWVDKLAA